VDWCCLDSSAWGFTRLQSPLRMLQILLSGVLRVCMVQTSDVIGGGFGMSWLGSLVGRTCLGVLGVISILLGSLAKDLEMVVCLP